MRVRLPFDWYYIRVLRRALSDTWAFIRAWAWYEGLAVTISEGVLLAVQGWPSTSKEWLILSAPLLGIGTVVVIVGAYGLVTAPIMLDRDHRAQIKSLQDEVRPKGQISLDYRIVGRTVHLHVTNKGPTNSLVAQVVAAEGLMKEGLMKEPTLPWSMKWDGRKKQDLYPRVLHTCSMLERYPAQRQMTTKRRN